MNWIALQIDNRLKYTSYPDASRPDAPTKEQMRELVSHAESYGMEVIPMTQCWSHFNYFLSKKEFRHLAEDPNPAPTARVKYWDYCPRNPETHKFLFSLIKEQLQCFPHAKYFHVGLDEISFGKIGMCKRCRGATGGQLLAEEIGRLHTFLKQRGLRMCMWGDQLLVKHNGGPPYNTAKALPKVPRDVIIFDWHYGRDATFPSVSFFAKKGFDVVACGWYEPENIANLTAEAFRNHILGYGGTTWYSIQRIRDQIRLITAMPLTSMFTWTRKHPPLAKVSPSPAGVFRRLYDGKPDFRPSSYVPLDLHAFFNSYLTDDSRRAGWFGTGHKNDFSMLPTGRQWFAGVPFDIPTDSKQCLLLAKEGDPEGRYPTQVWYVPIRRRARAVAILQTCSRPPAFSRQIYDRRKVNPGTVVTYVFHYRDGTKETVPCRWNVEISDWNSQLGSARAVTGWRGKTASGAVARVEVFQWQNPHPDVPLESVDIVSGMTGARPALLGMTLVE